MICIVCNSTQFDVHDGIYYCSECQTQIEETREEHSEPESFSRRSLLSSPTTKHKKDKRRFFNPWTTTEGFNFILYNQVSTLINCGASPNLKKVVLYLWSRYLQKCQVAFRTNLKSVEDTPRLGPFASKRDKQLLYGDKTSSNVVRYRRGKKLKKKKKQVLKKEKVVASSDLSDGQSEEIFSFESSGDFSETSGNPTTSETESFDANSDSSTSTVARKKIKYSVHAAKLHKKFSKEYLKNGRYIRRTCVSHMNLTKTLCFCYMGLLYLEDHLLLTDIIRLVKYGRIPYNNAVGCFPPSMKILHSSDFTVFNTKCTSLITHVLPMCERLRKFLILPKFKDPPLMPIIARFVMDLNLPNHILSIAKVIIDKLTDTNGCFESGSSNFRLKSVLYYDGQAMAIIIVALKMIFVLDGVFEIEHQEVATKINSLLRASYLFGITGGSR